jgi:3-hydroxybutyryl-CoA dehydrogenase
VYFDTTGTGGKKSMEIKVVGVIGAGQMGTGIAQVALTSGYSIIMEDISEAFVKKGADRIAKGLSKMEEKGKLKAGQAAALLARMKTTTKIEDLAGADFCIEAATENEKLKLDLFSNLDRICRPGVILATNTSSLPITRIAAATKRPEKVIGMHFMNPVPIMQGLELIRGLATDDETYNATLEMAKRMGKITMVSLDSPGFIINRILMPMINEAVFTLHENLGTPEDIDNGMKYGTNQPMGPLALADLIGLDTCLAIMEVLHRGLGDSKYRPCPLLRKYVDAGWLGKKTGRGFFKYQA